jgi:hypothetical protein
VLFLNFISSPSGKLIEHSPGLNPIWLNFQNGTHLGYSIESTYQEIPENFEPLGIAILPGNTGTQNTISG